MIQVYWTQTIAILSPLSLINYMNMIIIDFWERLAAVVGLFMRYLKREWELKRKLATKYKNLGSYPINLIIWQ